MKAGTYTIEWYLPESANYTNDGTIDNPNTKTVVINKAMASDTNKISISGDTWTYDKTAHSVTVGNSDGWTIVFRDVNGNVLSGAPQATDAGTYTFSWTAEHPAFESESGNVTLQCNKAPVQILTYPVGDTVSGEGIIREERTSSGQLMNTTYIPKLTKLIGYYTPGTCTEGGVFTYDGPESFQGSFATATGAQTRTQDIFWVLAPINDNYYIEGADPATGVLQNKTIITLRFVVKTEIVWVNG